MTFKEQLKKALHIGINIYDVLIADECDNVFDFEYTDEEFEQLCALTREIWLKGEDIQPYAIAHTINNLINDENYTINGVLTADIWFLINKASYMS